MRIGQARKTRRIQEVLDQCCPGGKSFSDVARDLGVSPQLVWATASGRNNNRRVLFYFLEVGVEPSVLDLPLDMLRPSSIAEALSA